MVVASGQQYNVGEKPVVMLYTYINSHSGTPKQSQEKVHDEPEYTNLYYIGFGIGLHFKEKHTKLDSNITHTTNIL